MGASVGLLSFRPTGMLDAMKTVTTREFYHAPALMKSLRPGQSLAVTDNGAASFTVIKAGNRPRKTRADMEREACEICPEAKPKANFTAALRQLKTR